MRLKEKIICLFSILSCLVFVQTSQSVWAESDTLRVGMEANYRPFNWTQPKADQDTLTTVDGEFVGGYDVLIAKEIGEKLHKKIEIVKLDWDGLIPSLQSDKIDLIIAGMSPTEERQKEIDFTLPYYRSELVMMVKKDSPYAKAKSIHDFKNARVTGQLGTVHYNVLQQLDGADIQAAMSDFATMRVALESNKIDAYISDQISAMQEAEQSDLLVLLHFEKNNDFQIDPANLDVSIGVRKNSPLKAEINQVLTQLTSDKRQQLMQKVLDKSKKKEKGNFLTDMWFIFTTNLPQLIDGTLKTIFISLIGTIVGLFIGLCIGIIRTMPTPDTKVKQIILKICNGLLNAYIEIFRGTPMIVQAMVVFYGSALIFGIDLNKLVAALLIVSVNTGAYMSEVVRGGVLSIDKGQFEACQAIGMSHLQAMRYVVMPQVLKNILPATGNEFVINIKDTSVLNVIGVAELYFVTKSIAATNYQFFQTFLVTCIFYFILTFTITRLLRWLERKLSGKANYTLASGNQMQV